MSTVEEWRVIPQFEDYLVSNLGRIRRATTVQGTRAGKILRPLRQPDGHLYQYVQRNKQRHFIFVHSAVLLAFVGPKPTPKHEAANWDGVPANNELNNLRWATRAENAADMVRHGASAKGSNHGRAKITEADVLLIRQMRKAGRTIQYISDQFEIGRTTVAHICNFDTWRHL